MKLNESLIEPSRHSVNNAFMNDAYRRADERLKERRQLWADLAKALGYSDQRVSNWKKRGIPAEAVPKVADFLGVSIDWLIHGKGSRSSSFQRLREYQASYLRRPDNSHLSDNELIQQAGQRDRDLPGFYINEPTEHDEIEFAGHLDAWDSQTELGPDEVEVPLFREVELAAGSGATQVIENHGAKLRFSKSTLSRAGVPAESAACAYVRGNSMEPMMFDGACIGVNTADTEVRDGKIYAIDHSGMLRVKILHRRPGGGLKLVSLNSEEHPTEEYPPDYVMENIEIKGKVFWYSGLL